MAITLQFSSAPYPGLRPFRYDESDIFFGRERQTDQVLDRLSRNRFLAITGPSGCGKSSLVKAGMIPALQAGFMAEVGSRWRICEFRPGERPIGRLAYSLASPEMLGANRGDEETAVFLEASLRRGPLGLIEIVRGSEALQGATLLVLVDQFEEIFRYRERIGADEADAFVALLLASAGQTEVPIYVAITMRSDYLGECAVFNGLAEAVSNSQYLTPRLTRAELERAISGPARVFGGQVEPRLLNRLLNDCGTAPDQLPLLQHALARLWTRCSAPATEPVLTVKDYEAIGGLAEALSRHGDEILAELTPEQRRIAEVMFRRLSAIEGGRRDVRSPARVNEVAKIAAVDPGQVMEVAEAFRGADRCFLAAPEGPLRQDTMLDISHESLIRQWRRLAGWAAAEATSAEMYRRLCEWALRWEQGKAELWRGPDLAGALDWRKRETPSPEWAKRYGDRDQFITAMRFLDASEETRRLTVLAETEKTQRQLRRVRHVALGLGLATASLAAVILGYLIAYVWEYDTYYKDYVKVWGVPRGIGEPLSTAELRHHSASYQITKKGRFGHVVHMQLVNAKGQPRNLAGTLDAMLSHGDDVANRVSRWEYVYDAEQRLAYEVLLDRNSKRIRSTFYPSDTQYAYAIGQDGSLAPEKGSCAAFYSYDYSPEGYVTQTHYLDQAGNPTPGEAGAFIKQRSYDRLGHVVRGMSLWKDGSPMNDQDGNSELRNSYDSAGNQVSVENFDASGRPKDAGKGLQWQRFTCSYDDRGNCVKPAMWSADGREIHSEMLNGIQQAACQSLILRYDDRGNMIGSACLMQDGQGPKSGMAVSETRYDEHDWPVEDAVFDRTGHPALTPLGGFRDALVHDADGNITELAFMDADGKPMAGIEGYQKKVSKFENGRETRTEYRDVEGKLVAVDGGFAAVERRFDTRGNEIQTAYLGIDGRPVPNRKEGFAAKTSSLDICGREIESEFLDENGHHTRSVHGYAGIRKVYDEANNVVEEDYTDERGQPIRSADGYAHITRQFDRNGNVTDERYFDEQGRPLLLKGGYAEHVSRFDDHNTLVEEGYLGTDGEPVLNQQGWAKQIRRYDDHSGLVEEAYFEAKGGPVLNDQGYARAVFVNDGRGRALEAAYYGTDGKLVATHHGHAKVVYHRDDNGRVVEESYFGADEAPVLSDAGYARETTEYNEFGRVIGWAYFGVRGEPVKGTTERYHRARVILDERGNRLELALFGTDDRPMRSMGGFATRWDRYDARNAVIEESYFGTDGKPVLSDDGYSRVTFLKDIHGKDLEIGYFGIDGKPVTIKQGYAKRVQSYDAYGGLVSQTFLGVEGESVLYDQQYARFTRINDSHGRIVEANHFGIDGKPTDRNAFHAFRINFAYDHDNQSAERVLYHAGNLIEHQRLKDREPDSDPIETTVTDRAGTLVDGADGYARCRFGKETQCFDHIGQPLVEAAMIDDVAPNSLAEQLQLHKGDLLVDYNGGSAASTDPPVKAVTGGEAETRTLLVIRDGHRLSVPVPRGPLGIMTRKHFVLAATLTPS